jgi:hypothetical protein
VPTRREGHTSLELCDREFVRIVDGETASTVIISRGPVVPCFLPPEARFELLIAHPRESSEQ